MSNQDTVRPELGREIATTGDGRDITRGYTGRLLLPYDSVLRNRGGYDLEVYERVFSDSEVAATFRQRQLAVTRCEWQVEPGGKRAIDRQAADFLKQQLHRVGWDNVTTKMLFGVFYGYSVAEMIYAQDGAQVVLDRIAVRNRRRFRFGRELELRLLTPQNMTHGEPALSPYFWNFCCGADNDDEPYGLGLGHWLYWPVWFKRNGIKFWLIFLEKFGMPTSVGKYDADANDDEKRKLLQATRAIQTDSGIIMPKGMELELIEAGRSGTADYKTLCDTMDAAIQKVIIGQTGSSSGTPGKLGNDDLMSDVRGDIIAADADLVCESFNTGPARWLTRWNFPTAEVPRVYRVTEPPEDLDARAARDKNIRDLGYKPTQVYVDQTYGPGWEPSASTLPELPPQPQPASFAEASAEPPDPSRPMAEQVDRRIKPIGKKWIGQVRKLVDDVRSLEELESRLVELSADLSLDEYATVLAEGMTAAALAGRADVFGESAQPED